jgi:glucose-6-phosphate isomerase
MQSFWDHPLYQPLRNQAQAIELQKVDLYESKRLDELTLSLPYWQMNLVHQDFDLPSFQQLTLLALNRQALNWMHAMQEGQLVNTVEGLEGERAALHTALRKSTLTDYPENSLGWQVCKQAKKERENIKYFLQSSAHFKNLIVLGIGGSQLGPEAIYEALKLERPSHNKVFFAPSLDALSHHYLKGQIDLKITLVAVISKSGSTLETAQGEKLWRQFFIEQGLNDKDHLVSITTPKSRLDRPNEFAACFYFDSSIGGRYSVCSSVGALPIAFAFGMNVFDQFLEGAEAMDLHALSDDRHRNGPLALACVSLWQRQVMKRPSHAIIAYKQGLHRFAAHLQQLEMESLGKSTDRHNQVLRGPAGPLIWGEPGTGSQHSFFQWLHQGTDIMPIDFIVQTEADFVSPHEKEMSDQLLANAQAQAIALAQGHQTEYLAKSCLGGRPSTFLTTPKLSAQALGALLSLYEHKTAFEGFILGLNPFDQEGVELGKKMAESTYEKIKEYREKGLIEGSHSWLKWLKKTISLDEIS